MYLIVMLKEAGQKNINNKSRWEIPEAKLISSDKDHTSGFLGRVGVGGWGTDCKGAQNSADVEMLWVLRDGGYVSVYTFVKDVQMIRWKYINYTSIKLIFRNNQLGREYALKNKNSPISLSLPPSIFCNQCLFQEVYILLLFLSCNVDFVHKSRVEKHY